MCLYGNYLFVKVILASLQTKLMLFLVFIFFFSALLCAQPKRTEAYICVFVYINFKLRVISWLQSTHTVDT